MGTCAFGAVFALTFVNRAGVERAAEGFLTGRLERGLGRLDLGDAPALRLFVDYVLGDLPGPAEALSIVRPEALREGLRARAARADLDDRTDERGQPYRRLLADLVHELRVFTGCNCALFALTLGLLVGWPGNDSRHLVLPAGLVAGTVGLAGAYFTAQDWLQSFLTGDYVGSWYLVLVGAVAALLADLAFNRARVTALILRFSWHWPV